MVALHSGESLRLRNLLCPMVLRVTVILVRIESAETIISDEIGAAQDDRRGDAANGTLPLWP